MGSGMGVMEELGKGLGKLVKVEVIAQHDFLVQNAEECETHEFDAGTSRDPITAEAEWHAVCKY